MADTPPPPPTTSKCKIPIFTFGFTLPVITLPPLPKFPPAFDLTLNISCPLDD